METERTVEQQLLWHAEQQTKALQNINWVLMALFVLVLATAGLWLVGLGS